MKGTGTVEAIHVAPEAEAPMDERREVEAVAGKGLRGDRYFEAEGTFSDSPRGGLELTLVEAEAIEAVRREVDLDLDYADHRRNVTTRDAALNHLVGERFRVGAAVCVGVRLCEPCDHLESLTEEGVVGGLTHRGGLRAEILDGGLIRTGDDIVPLGHSSSSP